VLSVCSETSVPSEGRLVDIEIELNETTREFAVGKRESLLDLLRAHGYTGAKRGCDTGACGFCTVIVDGEPRNSCVLPAQRVDGATVETIEGLGSQSDLHPVQEAFVDNTALQCGFCIPGMIIRSKAFLAENPDPTEAEIREGLSENLCRCTGYKKIAEAVLDAAERLDAQQPAADGGQPMGGAEDDEDAQFGCCREGGGTADGGGCCE